MRTTPLWHPSLDLQLRLVLRAAPDRLQPEAEASPGPRAAIRQHGEAPHLSALPSPRRPRLHEGLSGDRALVVTSAPGIEQPWST